MKPRMRVLIALLWIQSICSGVVLVGQERLGVTLNEWWRVADYTLTALIAWAFIYPILMLVEFRKEILRQRRELAVTKHYASVKATY